ncbi:unnamed protein product, partial [marine sediment metagenome]
MTSESTTQQHSHQAFLSDTVVVAQSLQDALTGRKYTNWRARHLREGKTYAKIKVLLLRISDLTERGLFGKKSERGKNYVRIEESGKYRHWLQSDKSGSVG